MTDIFVNGTFKDVSPESTVAEADQIKVKAYEDEQGYENPARTLQEVIEENEPVISQLWNSWLGGNSGSVIDDVSNDDYLLIRHEDDTIDRAKVEDVLKNVSTDTEISSDTPVHTGKLDSMSVYELAVPMQMFGTDDLMIPNGAIPNGALIMQAWLFTQNICIPVTVIPNNGLSAKGNYLHILPSYDETVMSRIESHFNSNEQWYLHIKYAVSN